VQHVQALKTFLLEISGLVCVDVPEVHFKPTLEPLMVVLHLKVVAVDIILVGSSQAKLVLVYINSAPVGLLYVQGLNAISLIILLQPLVALVLCLFMSQVL